jgi:hypothetical protein
MCVPNFWWIKLEKLGMTKLDEMMINYELVFWLPTKNGELYSHVWIAVFARENASEGSWPKIWPFEWDTPWDFGGPFMASWCAKSPTQTSSSPCIFVATLRGIRGIQKKSLRHQAQLQLTAGFEVIWSEELSQNCWRSFSPGIFQRSSRHRVSRSMKAEPGPGAPGIHWLLWKVETCITTSHNTIQ